MNPSELGKALAALRKDTSRVGHNGGRPPYKHYCPACRTKLTDRAFADAGQKCPVCSNVGVTEIQPRKKKEVSK